MNKQQCSVNIADDLFARASGIFEAYLRNCSRSDLKVFEKNDEKQLFPKLTTFFKPQDRFPLEAWVLMQELLTTVWEWAQAWRLHHYSFVHFGCLALIEGVRLRQRVNLPTPIPGVSIKSLPLGWLSRTSDHASSLPKAIDVVATCDARSGWYKACASFDMAAWIILESAIPKRKGFRPYRGAFTFADAADPRQAQQKYVEQCGNDVKAIIANSMLAHLPLALQEKILKEIEDIARNVCTEIDHDYNRRKAILPGRFHHKYGERVEWTAKRLILRQEWRNIAKESKAKGAKGTQAQVQDRIEKAVRKMLPKLFFPLDAATWGKQPPKYRENSPLNSP